MRKERKERDDDLVEDQQMNWLHFNEKSFNVRRRCHEQFHSFIFLLFGIITTHTTNYNMHFPSWERKSIAIYNIIIFKEPITLLFCGSKIIWFMENAINCNNDEVIMCKIVKFYWKESERKFVEHFSTRYMVTRNAF